MLIGIYFAAKIYSETTKEGAKPQGKSCYGNVVDIPG